jgi:hypothetical protein
MLLGTLLVSILTAHRRHVDQIRSAEERLAAIEAIDRLFSKWSSDGSWGATQNEGVFEGMASLRWRWTVSSPNELRKLGASTGRLAVTNDDGNPVCEVELLVPGTIAIRSANEP